jgi:hypothetical protein
MMEKEIKLSQSTTVEQRTTRQRIRNCTAQFEATKKALERGSRA